MKPQTGTLSSKKLQRSFLYGVIATLAVASLPLSIPALAANADDTVETIRTEVEAIWWALDLPAHHGAKLSYQRATTVEPLPADAAAFNALTTSAVVAYRRPPSRHRDQLRTQLGRKLRRRALTSNHLADMFLVEVMAVRDAGARRTLRPPAAPATPPVASAWNPGSRSSAAASAAASGRRRSAQISPAELARNKALRDAAIMDAQQSTHRMNMRIIENMTTSPWRSR